VEEVDDARHRTARGSSILTAAVRAACTRRAPPCRDFSFSSGKSMKRIFVGPIFIDPLVRAACTRRAPAHPSQPFRQELAHLV
jgi:hypothetical protein